jgi:hypothetical protein
LSFNPQSSADQKSQIQFLRSTTLVVDQQTGCCDQLDGLHAIRFRTVVGIANFIFVSLKLDLAGSQHDPRKLPLAFVELVLCLILFLDAAGVCYVRCGQNLRASRLQRYKREAFRDCNMHGNDIWSWGSFIDATLSLNVLEVILCFTGVVSGVNGISMSSYTFPNLSFLRLFANVKMFQRGQMMQWFWQSTQLRLVLQLLRMLPWTLLTLMAVVTLTFHVSALLAVQIIAMHRSFSTWNNDPPMIATSVETVVQGLLSDSSWSEFFRPLYTAGFVGPIVFVAIGSMFLFFLPGVTLSLFVQMTLQAMDNARGLRISLGLERSVVYVQRFTEAFDGVRVTDVDFKLMAPNLCCVSDFCDEFGFRLADLEDLMFCLSQGGTRSVGIQTLVMTCLKWQDTPSKMDMLEFFVKLQSIADSQKLLLRDTARTTTTSVTTMESTDFKRRPRFQDVDRQGLCSAVLNGLAAQHCGDISREQARQFRSTVESLLRIVLQCKGGGGFAVCTGRALVGLQRDFQVDFQVVDRSSSYPRGYMTEVLGSHHVATDTFGMLVGDFLDHSLQENDRWPPGHEAAGLPKDGFTILGIDGYRKIAAAKIVGLPVAPFKWDGVGSRHTMALALAWALRFGTSLVVVRSESGKVHALLPSETHVLALRCEPPA